MLSKISNNWIIVPENNKGFVLVECIAEIKNNATEEVREYNTNEILNDGEEFPSVFNWEENNFSCDCNRHLFFKRSKNEEVDSDWNVKCTTGKYSVNLKNKKDGKVYYKEFEK